MKTQSFLGISLSGLALRWILQAIHSGLSQIMLIPTVI